MKTLLFIALIMLATNLSRAQWEPDVRLTAAVGSSSPSGNTNAKVITASGDTVHVVWGDDRDGNAEIYYKRSTDNGMTWGADVRLTNSTGDSYDACLTVSGSVVHVFWCEVISDTAEEIYYKRSNDGGATWGADTRLTFANDYSESPAAVIEGSGIHVVWMDYIAGGAWTYEIYYKHSTDGGLTWGPDTRLTNNASYSGYPGVVVSGSIVTVTWEDDRDGGGEIYYKRSADGGLTWGDDIRLTNDPADSWDPAIALNGSVMHVVWMDTRDGADYEVYYKRSTDGGLTWGADTRLTNAAAPSEYPVIAVSGSIVHVAWQDQRNINYEIYYKRSEDAGLTWGADTRLTNAFGYSYWPYIAVGESAIHVVWYDSRDGNDEMYYKRNPTGNFYTGIGNDLVNGSGQQFSIYPNPASTSIHIDFENYSDKTATLSIRNILGEEVLNKPIHKGERDLDVSSLQNGLYFVGMKTGNRQTFSTKLVILK